MIPTMIFLLPHSLVLRIYFTIYAHMNIIEEEKVEFELLIIPKMRKHSNSFFPILFYSLSLTRSTWPQLFFLCAFGFAAYTEKSRRRERKNYCTKKSKSIHIWTRQNIRYGIIYKLYKKKGWGYKKESLKWIKNSLFFFLFQEKFILFYF